MLDLSVIIVNYNTKKLTLQCLTSVFEQNGLSYDVFVVDNASRDGSAEVIKENFSQVRLIVNNKNLGFAAANNQAIKLCKGSFILLLNSDTIVSPGTFKTMVKFMHRHLDAGIASCKVVKPNGALDWPCKRSFQTPSIFFYRALRLDELFPKSKQFGRYHLTYLDENRTHEVDGVCGAFLMIRKETIEDIGLMDEELFMYSDDMDWCFRAKKAGWKVYYYPQAQMLHFKSKSNIRQSYKSIYWWYYSTWYVYKKHMAKNYNFIINFCVYVGFCFMFSASLIVNFLRRFKSLPSRKS